MECAAALWVGMLLAASAVLSTLAVVAMPLFLPLQHGMSIGIGDTVADKDTGQKIGAIIDAAKEDVQRIIEQYQVRAASTLVRSEPKSVQSLHACGAYQHHDICAWCRFLCMQAAVQVL